MEINFLVVSFGGIDNYIRRNLFLVFLWDFVDDDVVVFLDFLVNSLSVYWCLFFFLLEFEVFGGFIGDLICLSVFGIFDFFILILLVFFEVLWEGIFRFCIRGMDVFLFEVFFFLLSRVIFVLVVFWLEYFGVFIEFLGIDVVVMYLENLVSLDFFYIDFCS